jgi:hypothetical protein
MENYDKDIEALRDPLTRIPFDLKKIRLRPYHVDILSLSQLSSLLRVKEQIIVLSAKKSYQLIMSLQKT